MASRALERTDSQTSQFKVMDWGSQGDFLTAVAPVPPTASAHLGWRIVLRQAWPASTEALKGLRLSLAALGLLSMVIIVLTAYTAASRISRPLEAVSEAARRIQAGDRDIHFPADARSLEVYHLNRSLEAMTQALRAHETELEEQVRIRTIELEQAIILLEQLSSVDALTGVFNRRRLEERLKEWMLLFQRSQRPFSVLLLDIDHFKSVNDNYGHDVGDQVLRTFAQVMRSAVRTTDFVARYGGEEFVVVLPETGDVSAAAEVAEKIRQSVEATEFPVPRRVTVSIGISLSQTEDESVAALLKRADMALYAAKAAGRNQVMAYDATLG